MKADEAGFMFPTVDEAQCVECGRCLDVCAFEQKGKGANGAPTVYAAVIRNKEVLAQSSSGGIFTALAEAVLEKGGTVFGAAWTEGFSLKHIAVQSKKDLAKLRGSKYVQSEIGESYLLARSYLEQGRLVLFTGTPCQIAGLKTFLNKEYSNLYLMDIVCHGVPSPDVWDAYLTHLEKQYGGKTKRVAFRDKTNGWENYLLRVEMDNGAVYSNDRINDLYMRGFLHNCFLRSSCYECMHKGTERGADITLGDFWGIGKICPELQDGKGTSLVIASSPKGKFLLAQISAEVRIQKVALDDLISFNPAIVQAASYNPIRETFEKEFRQKPIMVVLKKYCSMSKFKKLKRAIKSIMKCNQRMK
jgi:coenzyme F420-reducing hydrogenase beta subunit